MTSSLKHSFLSWAEIDLDAITWNVKAIQRHVGDKVEVMPAVKANAYGHGAIQVSKAALQAGATRLAVHRLSEAIQLRKAGIDAPVLTLGYTPPTGAEEIVRWDITASAITPEFLQAVSSIAMAEGKRTNIHIKVDTGMSRYGLLPEEVLEFVRWARDLPGIFIEGLFTHFATADSSDSTHVLKQIEIFNQVRKTLEGAGIVIPKVHAANSATIMRYPQAHFDIVRPGISFYGMTPSSEWPPAFEIRPALTLKSRICRIREIPAESGVSYGRTYITHQPTLVGLVAVGYGDGYHRILSNKGGVLVNGKRAPILGRVCMDQFVVDITGIPGVAQDSEVVLVGRQGNDQILAEEVGKLAGSINYEVTTSLLNRVARIYLRAGEIVEISSLEEEK